MFFDKSLGVFRFYFKKKIKDDIMQGYNLEIYYLSYNKFCKKFTRINLR